MICEIADLDYTLLRRNDFLKRRQAAQLVDAKSLYDHTASLPSPAAGVKDTLTSVDFTILREITKDTGIETRWGPSELQLADALTKDSEDASARLRGAMRKCEYQLVREGVWMEQRKAERQRKEDRKKKAQLNENEQKQQKKGAKTEFHFVNDP